MRGSRRGAGSTRHTCIANGSSIFGLPNRRFWWRGLVAYRPDYVLYWCAACSFALAQNKTRRKNLETEFKISATFKIPNRGLILAGFISKGLVYPADWIEFTAFGKRRKRNIIGVEGIRHINLNGPNTGLLIQCENDEEIDELREWEPDDEIGVITRK